MSAVLLGAVVAFLREQFTPQEVATVAPYGGQFSGEELDHASYVCPAILVTVLGWHKAPPDARLGGRHVREVSMAAFVACKGATREQRMAEALTLAERVGIKLYDWRPAASTPFEIAGLAQEPVCENLYGRAIDKAGQALWLLRWTQCIRPTVPPDQLYDLVAVDIRDSTWGGRPLEQASPEAPATLTVTEDVTFVPHPPLP